MASKDAAVCGAHSAACVFTHTERERRKQTRSGKRGLCVRLRKLGGGSLWKGLQGQRSSLLACCGNGSQGFFQQGAALLPGERSSPNKHTGDISHLQAVRGCLELVQKD